MPRLRPVVYGGTGRHDFLANRSVSLGSVAVSLPFCLDGSIPCPIDWYGQTKRDAWSRVLLHVPNSHRPGMPYYGSREARYAAIATMSSTLSFCTTPCISAADGPERLPSWKK